MQSKACPVNNHYIIGNLDTSFLKLLALALMLVDHLGVSLFPGIRELRIIGRMAFPLYAWCLVVGSVKTRSIVRYGLRLLLLGLVSQPLYMIALNHSWRELNILFTLFIGLVAIYSIQKKYLFSHIWGPALCFILIGFIQVDYGWKGLAFILVLYGSRKTKSGLATAYIAYALFWGSKDSVISSFLGYSFPFLSWPGIGSAFTALFRMQGMIWLSLPLILIPTKTNIQLPQWLGYTLYPLHLVVLIIVQAL